MGCGKSSVKNDDVDKLPNTAGNAKVVDDSKAENKNGQSSLAQSNVDNQKQESEYEYEESYSTTYTASSYTYTKND